MQYLLTVHTVEGADPPAEAVVAEMYADVDAVNSEIEAAGAWVFAGGLLEPDTATVVRPGDGEVLVTDGPFVEGREHIGGFWIIDVADRDAAAQWAARASRACRAPVEVRAFVHGEAG